MLRLRHGGDAVNHRVRESRVRLYPLPQLGAYVARHLQHHVLDLHHRASVGQAGCGEGGMGSFFKPLGCPCMMQAGDEEGEYLM